MASEKAGWKAHMQNKEENKRKIKIPSLASPCRYILGNMVKIFLEQLQHIPWSRKPTVITINLIIYDTRNNVRQ